jgi:hypothetical protein
VLEGINTEGREREQGGLERDNVVREGFSAQWDHGKRSPTIYSSQTQAASKWQHWSLNLHLSDTKNYFSLNLKNYTCSQTFIFSCTTTWTTMGSQSILSFLHSLWSFTTDQSWCTYRGKMQSSVQLWAPVLSNVEKNIVRLEMGWCRSSSALQIHHSDYFALISNFVVERV